MAEEHRRVAAASEANARVLAETLVNQGFVVTSASAAAWVLRRTRWRGDVVVTIAIGDAGAPSAPGWGPPSGPPAR